MRQEYLFLIPPVITRSLWLTADTLSLWQWQSLEDASRALARTC